MPMYEHAKPLPTDIATALAHLPKDQQILLYNRGITNKTAADAWLNPLYDQALHDPFLLPDMEVAVQRILAALAANEKVIIYADYDCDGIPGAVVFHDFFTEVGFTNFEVYIPHRHYEGFGFNASAAAELAAAGAQLIITVDCGTTDHVAVAAAQERNVDVIITDHHQSKETLPDALAVVNPAVSDSYPFPHLCGAGVVYKVVQALLERGNFQVIPGREKWWLDMVGLATIADMVSLTEENRTLAHYGLRVLRKSRRPGLQLLLKKQRASQPHLSEDDIGFTIGPRINAASRMGEPLRAFQLLTAKTTAEATDHLAHLEQLNLERKGAVAAMTRAAHKKISLQPEAQPVIVLGDPEWRPSLVGLVANKLSEEHNAPAFVWGRDGNGVIKGSCRGDGTVSVIALMQAAHDHFIEYGGHHASGGFAVHEQAIHTLPEQLQAAFQSLDGADTAVPPISIDLTLEAAELTVPSIRTMLQLAPFGVDNPKPLLQITNVIPQAVDNFGKANEHTKILVPTANSSLEAIAFFKNPEQFSHVPSTHTTCVVLAHPEQSFFMGRMQTRLRLVDILTEPIV